MGRWEKAVPGKYLSSKDNAPLPPHCWVFVRRRIGVFVPLAYIFCRSEKDHPGVTRWFSVVFQPKPPFTPPPAPEPTPSASVEDDPEAAAAAMAKVYEAQEAWEKAPAPVKVYWAPDKATIMTGTERLLQPAFREENKKATAAARFHRKHPWIMGLALGGYALGMLGMFGKRK